MGGANVGWMNAVLTEDNMDCYRRYQVTVNTGQSIPQLNVFISNKTIHTRQPSPFIQAYGMKWGGRGEN